MQLLNIIIASEEMAPEQKINLFKKFYDLLPSLGQLIINFCLVVIVIAILIATVIGIWYCCVSSIERPVKDRTKWYHIPINDIGKYCLLKRCYAIFYKNKDNHLLSKDFSESMFMEPLCSKFYAKDTNNRVSRMLKNRGLVKKYFSKERFEVEEFYAFFSEYITEYIGEIESDLIEVAKHLPLDMRTHPLCVKCFYLLIKAGILDVECQPITEGEDSKGMKRYYYVLADTIKVFCSENGNKFARDKNFAELWLKSNPNYWLESYKDGKPLTKKDINRFMGNMRVGISEARKVNKYYTIQNEILAIIKEAKNELSLPSSKN